MDAFRAVRPPKLCAAGSSWWYASTSTILPPTRVDEQRRPDELRRHVVDAPREERAAELHVVAFRES